MKEGVIGNRGQICSEDETNGGEVSEEKARRRVKIRRRFEVRAWCGGIIPNWAKTEGLSASREVNWEFRNWWRKVKWIEVSSEDKEQSRPKCRWEE